jgi:prevent-host-death family protein
MPPKAVSVHEAKTQLSKLLVRVTSGETIVIERRGEPVAQLVAVGPRKSARVPGNDAVRLHGDFEKLPSRLRKAFGAR